MNAQQVEEFIMKLDNVQQVENFGYTFFFVGDDHRLPFVTIGHTDNEFDAVSRLVRDGVFRINIGISRRTFDALLGDYNDESIDYSELDIFLPHPHYAKQHFVCILNPTAENVDITRNLILEAHQIAETRFQKKRKSG